MKESQLKPLIRRNLLEEAEEVAREWVRENFTSLQQIKDYHNTKFKELLATPRSYVYSPRGLRVSRHDSLVETTDWILFKKFLSPWLEERFAGKVLEGLHSYLFHLYQEDEPMEYFLEAHVTCLAGVLSLNPQTKLIPGPLFPELPEKRYLKNFLAEEIFFTSDSEEFLERLKPLREISPNDLSRILHQAVNLGLDLNNLAEVLQVHPGTILQWVGEESSPSEAFRGSVLIAIQALLKGENPFPELT